MSTTCRQAVSPCGRSNWRKREAVGVGRGHAHLRLVGRSRRSSSGGRLQLDRGGRLGAGKLHHLAGRRRPDPGLHRAARAHHLHRNIRHARSDRAGADHVTSLPSGCRLDLDPAAAALDRRLASVARWPSPRQKPVASKISVAGAGPAANRQQDRRPPVPKQNGADHRVPPRGADRHRAETRKEGRQNHQIGKQRQQRRPTSRSCRNRSPPCSRQTACRPCRGSARSRW